MPKHFYPAMIILLLGTFLVFSGWSAYRAATRSSQITDRDYYSKGLKFNATLVEKRAASVLGWQLRSELLAHTLHIRLLDGQGLPVSGAVGKLVFHQPQEKSSRFLRLHEAAPGAYLAELPGDLKGGIPIRIDFERSGARVNRQLLLNF
jgi:nitrogen fixation protein FixH